MSAVNGHHDHYAASVAIMLTRVPEVLVFSTIQPVMFVLLFRYVFGGSIDTGQPGGYVQLLMPGIFVQTVAFTLAGTAVRTCGGSEEGFNRSL